MLQLDKLTKLTLQDKKLDAVVPRIADTSRTTDSNSQELELPQTARSQLSAASRVTSTSSAFSKRMEERAFERAKAKQDREERKRKQEQERIVS